MPVYSLSSLQFLFFLPVQVCLSLYSPHLSAEQHPETGSRCQGGEGGAGQRGCRGRLVLRKGGAGGHFLRPWASCARLEENGAGGCVSPPLVQVTETFLHNKENLNCL